jgi:hypothetical protein
LSLPFVSGGVTDDFKRFFFKTNRQAVMRQDLAHRRKVNPLGAPFPAAGQHTASMHESGGKMRLGLGEMLGFIAQKIAGVDERGAANSELPIENGGNPP